ncbi:hypothetical protein ACFY15_00690 [Streptomyces sp. NPDC001373]|uniref:hypothetical protein n=1 Tax=Streptomyces sp. NPDC001373 TaxID=3364565 RepID=UPI003679945E
MRRLGDASHLLGIRPWEWRLLDVEEAEHVHAWLDSYEQAQRDANEQMKRGR